MMSRMMWTAVAVLGLGHTFAGALVAQDPLPDPGRRGWLGIGYREEPDRRTGDRTYVGIVIETVVEDSPADRAGLEPADTIVGLNGRTPDVRELELLARSIQPGDTLHLRVRRGGREHEFTVVAAERPLFVTTPSDGPRVIVFDTDSLRRVVRVHLDSIRMHLDTVELPRIRFESAGPRAFFFGFDDRAFRLHTDSLGWRFEAFDDSIPGFEGRVFVRPDFPVPFDSLWTRGRAGDFAFDLGLGLRAVAGAEFTEVNPGLARYFGVDEGLLVLRVAPGTPAARAGLTAGDVVLEAHGRPVHDVADLRRAVAAAAMDDRPMTLRIVREGERRELRLPRQE